MTQESNVPAGGAVAPRSWGKSMPTLKKQQRPYLRPVELVLPGILTKFSLIFTGLLNYLLLDKGGLHL